jgi:hypothetical protein
MKKVNKILISIFLISILVATVTTSANTDIPISAPENITNPTSDTPVAEIEEAKLPTPAEEKARFENRMKYAPKALGNQKNKSVQKTIEQLPRELNPIINTIPLEVAYTNPISGISTFATRLDTGWISNSNYQTWNSYTFYLPVASYVDMDVSGQLDSFYDWAYFDTYIDGDSLDYRYFTNVCEDSNSFCYVPIQASRLTYLSKGWHTLYTNGYAGLYETTDNYKVYGYISITAFPEYTAITVINPNGGESWTKGTTKTIKWTKVGQPGANVKIELYKAGVLNSVISPLTPNDGQYSWYIPTSQTIGTDYKIKISSTSEPTKYFDWSNNNFSIN